MFPFYSPIANSGKGPWLVVRSQNLNICQSPNPPAIDLHYVIEPMRYSQFGYRFVYNHCRKLVQSTVPNKSKFTKPLYYPGYRLSIASNCLGDRDGWLPQPVDPGATGRT